MATRDYDFIGFTYGGKHSIDDFGIYRTSDGNRYNINLIPQLNDKTADVPGSDGQYYFGSYYKTRQFSISIAFDSLSEELYSSVRNWLNGKEIQELIFDETPYKVYSAKVTGTPQLKVICFEERGQRVYKGEGSIQFTCYYPYSHSPTLTKDGKDGRSADSYSIDNYPTKAQWIGAARLSKKHTDGNNPGDLEAPFIYKSNGIKIFHAGDKIQVGALVVTLQEECSSLEWDSKTGLIVGVTNQGKRVLKTQGKSYGAIPVGGIEEESICFITNESGQEAFYLLNNRKRIGNQEFAATTPFTIEYNYWYY